jgi:low temperature requirement protein LtrA
MEHTPNAPPHREVDWYELFFDLVFVVVVAVSARLIEVDPRLHTVLVFMLLFFPVWWCWVNLMVTNNLYGQAFPINAVLTIAAMPGPAAMAIAIASGIDHSGWLYAIGAAWVRLVLLVMWMIPYATKAVSVPLWRPLTYNLATAGVWVASIAVPDPYRYVCWVVAVAAEVFLLALRQGGFSDTVYEQASISLLLERVGLFVVIVIGEAVYLSVTTLAEHPTIGGGAAALFGFVVCAYLARAFFRWGVPTTEAGLAAARSAQSYGAMRDVVMYLPFLVVTALTLIAAAVGFAAENGSEPLSFEARTLLGLGIGAFYLANAIGGLRLGRPVRGILQLLVPGLLLPGLACFLSANLAAWATVALAAAAVAALDLVSKLLGFRVHGADAG